MFCLATNASLRIPLNIIFFIKYLEYISEVSLTYLATQDVLVALILKKDMLKYKFYLHKETNEKPLTIPGKDFL